MLAGVEGARKVAVDAVFDSVSVATTFREELKKAGRHLPLDLRGDPRISRAGAEISRQRRPAARQLFRLPQQRGLLRRHLRLRARGRPLPDGAVSTYFRINAENTGQFERTLIVADKGSYVSYLEGCTAPMRDENQLHAAVVEIFAHEDAEVKYSTVQNWYPGDAEGKGGIFNFVTKRALCAGDALEGQLDPGRDRQRDHLEISELHPEGRWQRRRILFGRADQQPPAGRHRHQDDPHRRQHALDHRLQGHQRRPVEQHLSRAGARAPARRERPQLHPVRFSCCWAATAARTPCPTSRSRTRPRQIEHEATTSKISEDQLFYAMIARPRRRKRGRADRQRLRPRGAEAAADGVRGRGAEAAGDQPGGERGMITALLIAAAAPNHRMR